MPILVALLITLLWLAPARAELPANPLLDGLGVNIHFTDPRPGEMEMLAAAGVKWVRMDLNWSGIERNKGVYDFAAYDHLVAALEKHGMHAIFILDYGNRMYDNGTSPHTDDARAGFAKWAAATAKHFAGRGMIWEMWNEPNGSFWKPTANVDDYAKLALSVGKAMREEVPNEMYIGPATSGVDLKFIEACFKAGCLEYWSAVSVHPYRQSNPESAASDYRKLRQLIFEYAPKGKKIPIISGEWGYSAAWKNFDEQMQGKYLAREFLTNLWQEIPISIWYDWHDDGTDPKEPEHHFGTVHNSYLKDQSPVYEPKPAYVAMKTLADQLAGYKFNERLILEHPDDYALLFIEDTNVKIVAWTTAPAHEARLPASAGSFSVANWNGESANAINSDPAGLKVTLNDAPVYLHPDKTNELLTCAAGLNRLPLEVFVRWPQKAKYSTGFSNYLDHSVTVNIGNTGPATLKGAPSKKGSFFDWEAVGASFEPKVSRTADLASERVDTEFAGIGHIMQQTQIITVNPLTITVLPHVNDAVSIRVFDPDKAGFKANVTLVGIEGLELEKSSNPIEVKPGEAEATISFPAKADGPDYSLGVQITDDKGATIAELPQQNFGTIADFSSAATDGKVTAYTLAADGDSKLASEQSLTLEPPPEGAPQAGMGVLKLAYQADRGWKFWRVAAARPALQTITGEPKWLGLWVHGDASESLIRLRFVDSTGQTFQPAGERITWKGWRYITIPMDAASAAGGHWGGKNDGVIHYPIKWDTLFLLDHSRERAIDGVVYIGGATLIRPGTAQ